MYIYVYIYICIYSQSINKQESVYILNSLNK